MSSGDLIVSSQQTIFIIGVNQVALKVRNALVGGFALIADALNSYCFSLLY